MKSQDVNRRSFLTSAGVTATATATAGFAVQASRGGSFVQPSETVNVGFIGLGGMGGYNLSDFLRAPEVRVTALCDVDDSHLAQSAEVVAKKQGKPPALLVKDFRKLLDRKDIDAVVIATPDHWHAIPFVLACQAEKHVYCEKPVSHNIREGRAMVNAARKFKRVTQIGIQQRSGEHFQKARELVQSGKLGRISLTRTWNFSNETPNGFGKPNDQDQAPTGVDYDRWLGPAPLHKFNPMRFHGTFRWFYDYAAGMVGDWNVHLQDIIHWSMGVTSPKSVCAVGGLYAVNDLRDTPDTLVVTYEFDGPQGPFIQMYEMRKGNGYGIGGNAGHGMQFHGTDATLYLDRDGFRVIPETNEKGKDRTPAVQSGGSDQHWPHVQEFLRNLKTGARCIADIEDGHNSTVVCHLANISWKLGRKIYWDGKTEVILTADGKPDEQANALLGRQYRKGYELPNV